MAPEYLVKGQLKNNAFVEDTGSLLQTVIAFPPLTTAVFFNFRNHPQENVCFL